MKRPSRDALLQDILGDLIRHFGDVKVRAALGKLLGDQLPQSKKTMSPAISPSKNSAPNILDAMDEFQDSDPKKYRTITSFYERLKNREVLPDGQDIRHFAQLVGIKNVEGRSRKDMVPSLVRLLMILPADRLEKEISRADGISEQQRNLGFSVLTDKLLGEK